MPNKKTKKKNEDETKPAFHKTPLTDRELYFELINLLIKERKLCLGKLGHTGIPIRLIHNLQIDQYRLDYYAKTLLRDGVISYIPDEDEQITHIESTRDVYFYCTMTWEQMENYKNELTTQYRHAGMK